MNSHNELKPEISANHKDFREISSIRKALSDGLLARGVGFEPTRPFLTTDLAGLPPTRLGQPRPVFTRLSHLFWRWRCCFWFRVIFVSSGILGYLFEGRAQTEFQQGFDFFGFLSDSYGKFVVCSSFIQCVLDVYVYLG